ncbi:MAG: Ig-like domain-containing protein, partial [Bacteroidaceae bacterium]|nr:Ig-like domain-containing protein [Bacteroidaceae bacterium]
MKRNIFVMLLMMAACVQTAWSQGMKVWHNGKYVFYNVSTVDSVQVISYASMEEHEWVDLGLPSGTLWATCNVGADSPNGVGSYFAWGETEPKSDYSWSTYELCKGDENTLTKYCFDSSCGYNGFTDTLTELLPDDDAATANWGSEWQMPSKAQVQELIDENNTIIEWLDERPRGAIITSKTNGNSIFLPAGGYYDGTVLEGRSSSSVIGYSVISWTRSLDSATLSATTVFFNGSLGWSCWKNNRCCGQTVRPVRKQDSTSKLVTRIDLSETSLNLQQGDVASLFATVLPVDADNPAVRWESSNRSVAEVRFDATGTGTFDPSGAPVANGATVIAMGVGTCTIYCRATDGSGVYAECQVTVTGGDTSDHEYVDLGLPSGTLWATCNIGANSPEEYGDYFAWGETTAPKEYYIWGNYQWMIPGGENWYEISKYTIDDNQTSGCWYRNEEVFVGDGVRELTVDDDAAVANWGASWRMPSVVQFEELINTQYTTATWETVNGKKGKKITSKRNGKSIFLPAAGYWDGSLLYDDNTCGRYWSRELSDNFTDWATYLYFSQNEL